MTCYTTPVRQLYIVGFPVFCADLSTSQRVGFPAFYADLSTSHPSLPHRCIPRILCCLATPHLSLNFKSLDSPYSVLTCPRHTLNFTSLDSSYSVLTCPRDNRHLYIVEFPVFCAVFSTSHRHLYIVGFPVFCTELSTSHPSVNSTSFDFSHSVLTCPRHTLDSTSSDFPYSMPTCPRHNCHFYIIGFPMFSADLSTPHPSIQQIWYGTLSIETAKSFGRSCTLLRHSGCNRAAVKEDFVPADCLAGRVARVTTFCCQNRRFSAAVIDLDCDYFSGPIEVCVVKDSVADVILGNIKNVRSLTVTRKVNVTTWAQSKRATTEVPAGPQEVLSKSLVDSSLIPEPVSVSTVTPLRFPEIDHLESLEMR
ncbi:hypothetical protein PoB_002478500 [Plakobranchus ocellatus]|uniref:Uncharacterized protein n=1 Tax=Plakobranchus ocellatus TaxID=259542 RepID=A0AAV3ZT53_9GAST|nr:hypothetical protein PoB_002478500 [Plakobranchus ocellatus]